MNFTTYVNETKTVEYAVHDVDKLLHVEELPDTGKPVEVQSKDIQIPVSYTHLDVYKRQPWQWCVLPLDHGICKSDVLNS